MSGDIVERLRVDCECYDGDTCVHAAARDEIERLWAEIKRLRAELELHRANTREAIVKEVMAATERVRTSWWSRRG